MPRWPAPATARPVAASASGEARRMSDPRTDRDPTTTELHEGPDGAYSIAFYQDEYGNGCPKDEAVRVSVVEYDEAGNWLFEAEGFLGQ